MSEDGEPKDDKNGDVSPEPVQQNGGGQGARPLVKEREQQTDEDDSRRDWDGERQAEKQQDNEEVPRAEEERRNEGAASDAAAATAQGGVDRPAPEKLFDERVDHGEVEEQRNFVPAGQREVFPGEARTHFSRIDKSAKQPNERIGPEADEEAKDREADPVASSEGAALARPEAMPVINRAC